MTNSYTWGQDGHPEESRQAGGIGHQEFYEIQDQKMLSIKAGKEESLRWYRVGPDQPRCSFTQKDLQVLVNGKLGTNPQCVLAARKDKSILGYTNRATAEWSMELITTSLQHLWDWSQVSSFGSSSTEETLSNWSEFRLGALSLWGEAEEAGKETSSGRPNCSLQVLQVHKEVV